MDDLKEILKLLLKMLLVVGLIFIFRYHISVKFGHVKIGIGHGNDFQDYASVT